MPVNAQAELSSWSKLIPTLSKSSAEYSASSMSSGNVDVQAFLPLSPHIRTQGRAVTADFSTVRHQESGMARGMTPKESADEE
jgi:hypothetical protein